MWNNRDEEKVKETAPMNTPDKKTSSSFASTGNGQALIGHTIVINGEVSGTEDLLIQGTVEGKITLKDNTLTVGRNGSVNASINARVITIDGTLEGNIKGTESITINESGRVTGDIEAPRVILKDGCHFKGGVQMQDVKSTSSTSSTNSAKPASSNISSTSSTSSSSTSGSSFKPSSDKAKSSTLGGL